MILTEVELAKPALEHGPSYLAMVDEFIEIGEGYPYNNIELARADFAAFVQELEDEAHGIGIPPEIPPQQTYLLVKDRHMVVGEIRFRPVMSEPFERYNGHVAYNIRPSQRGRGYATRQLSLVLDEARKLQLLGVSLTVSPTNRASVRIIEKCGGRPIRAISSAGELLYWIDLASIR